MNNTEITAQLNFTTKQKHLRRALTNITSLTPPGDLNSHSANEITPSPKRHTTCCRYLHCPGDNTVEVARCEACKEILSIMFNASGDVAN